MKCNNACLCLNYNETLPSPPPLSSPLLPCQKKCGIMGTQGILLRGGTRLQDAHAEKAGCEGRHPSRACLIAKHAHALTKRPGALPDSLSKCSAALAESR